MPAVDPARLAHEIERMLQEAQEPSARARGAADLLERYAERARRKPARPEEALNAPRIVVSAVGRALAEETSNQRDGLALASALWSIPHRDARLLATEVLGKWDGARVADWAEDQAPETADLRLLEELAARGLAAWTGRERARGFRRVGNWLAARKPRLRDLGLLVLLSVVGQGNSDDLRLVIHLLKTSPDLGTGPERKTFSRLVIALARRNPRETAGFLLDEVRRGNQPVLPIARQALPLLPARQQQVLEDALAHAGPSGIIPPS